MVVRVGGQRDAVAEPLLDKLERPGADRLAGVEGARLEVLRRDGAEDMLRDNAVHHVDRHEGGDDVLEREDDGLRVLGRDRGDIPAQARRAGRAAFRVHVEIVAELHIIGGEGLAIVPLDALFEREGVRLAVRRDIPFRGEIRRRLQGVRVGIDKRIEEERHETVRDDVPLRHRVESGDIAARADDDRAALLDTRSADLRLHPATGGG